MYETYSSDDSKAFSLLYPASALQSSGGPSIARGKCSQVQVSPPLKIYLLRQEYINDLNLWASKIIWFLNLTKDYRCGNKFMTL